MKIKSTLLALSLFTLSANAQNFTTEVNVTSTSQSSSALNLKNDYGFWHLSGPRSYEGDNKLALFWKASSGTNTNYQRVLEVSPTTGFSFLKNATFTSGLISNGSTTFNGGANFAYSANFAGLITFANTGAPYGWMMQRNNQDLQLKQFAYQYNKSVLTFRQNGGIIMDGVANQPNLLRLQNGDNAGGNQRLEFYKGTAASAGFYVEANHQTDKLSIGVRNGSTADNSLFTITQNGNIGIGTTSPGTYKLAVEGTIGAREIQVLSTNPWPDYVFAKEYKLMSLEDVEAYIQSNQHLPNIPNADEVKANGIKLAEMNGLLMQKIEELTLYMIEMKKDNNEIKKENQALKTAIELLSK